MLTGRTVRLPVDMAFGSELDTPRGRQELSKRMQDIRQGARIKAQQSAERIKKQYDNEKKTSNSALKAGDIVYWRNPKGGKLSRLWSGPYKLQAMESETNCRIVGADGKDKVVHINQLKPCDDPEGRLGILRGRGRPKKNPSGG